MVGFEGSWPVVQRCKCHSAASALLRASCELQSADTGATPETYNSSPDALSQDAHWCTWLAGWTVGWPTFNACKTEPTGGEFRERERGGLPLTFVCSPAFEACKTKAKGGCSERGEGGPTFETNTSQAHQGLVRAPASRQSRRRTWAANQSGCLGCVLIWFQNPRVSPGVATFSKVDP